MPPSLPDGRPVLLRRATEEDVPHIAEIYNEAVIHSTATFDISPKTLVEKAEWLRGHDPSHPVIVAEFPNGWIAGWASLSKFSDRPCYSGTVEDSVYVRSEARRRGIGSLLLETLIVEARRAGHHAILARIDSGNEPSIRLHERLGFRRVGVLREVGFKFGRWLDVIIMELLLGSTERPDPPEHGY